MIRAVKRSAAAVVRALVVTLALLLLPSVAAGAEGDQTTLLLSPSGQPVGGTWQQWMDGSYMPTFAGPMVLDLGDVSACESPSVAACTASEVISSNAASGVLDDPETLIATTSTSSTGHWTLLYEQAHVLDARYLTDAERAQFLSLWHQPPPPDWVTMTDYWLPPNYQSDPTWFYDTTIYGEWFADDYALCAMLPRWTLAIDGRLQYPMAGDEYPGLADLNNLLWGRYRGKWFETGRITKRDRWALRTQQQSCRLMRGWIMAATGSMADTSPAP